MNIYEQDLIQVNKDMYPYKRRFDKYYAAGTESYDKQDYEPLLSVVIPVYNVLDKQLRECIDSIKAQTYPNWELYLVDDNSSWESVRVVLSSYEDDERIHVIYRQENGHISRATNDGINAASGEFIAFMDCDDFIEPYCFAEMVYFLNAHPDTDFIYSDEDKVDDDGLNNHYTFFKPDWSPDTFWSMMYTNHLAMYRREIVVEIGGLRTDYNGSQDYDMTLRFMERSDNKRVGHVPRVLYHWRERPESAAADLSAKPYAIDAARRAKEDAIRRRGINGEMEFVDGLFQYIIRYHTPGDPLVSIIIPSKDNPAVLFRCLDTLTGITDYKNYEIIIVDNGSEDYNRRLIEDRLDAIRRIGIAIDYIYDKSPFNFSKMCNQGVAASHGEYILLLNDDIEIIDSEWLDRMLGQAMQSHTGAVGAKLLYPINNCIQHIGICNIDAGPSHIFMGTPDSAVASFNRNRVPYNYLAVTGAALMVSREKWDTVGGLDEALTVGYNDIDLCFKLHEAGYYNVTRTDVMLYHHESMSRGLDAASSDKRGRLAAERRHLYTKHPDLFGYDPYYNVNLAGDRLDMEIDMRGVLVNYDDFEMTYTSYPPVPTDMLLSIDSITKDDVVRLAGWASSGDSMIDLSAKRYIMLRALTGQTYLFPTIKLSRPEITSELGISNMTEGFECIIDRKLLATSTFAYDVGMMQYGADGRMSYVWSDKTIPVDGVDDVHFNWRCFEKRIDISAAKPTDKIRYAIDYHTTEELVCDSSGVYEAVTYIGGWALLHRGKSYNHRIYIGVEGESGDLILYDTLRLPRYDVARSMRRKSAYLCGFEAKIPGVNPKIYVVIADMISHVYYMRELVI